VRSHPVTPPLTMDRIAKLVATAILVGDHDKDNNSSGSGGPLPHSMSGLLRLTLACGQMQSDMRQEEFNLERKLRT
jgi:hypothetical protein